MKAEIAIEVGLIDRASVVPLAQDPDSAFLVIVGAAGRITIEARIDDLWKVACACRDGVRLREGQRVIEDRKAEAAA